jgi:hypothetical protein
MDDARPAAVRFVPIDDDGVRGMSVLEVETIHDLRSDRFGGTQSCGTCGGNSLSCVGHFGHIELPVTVDHPLLPGVTMSCLAVPPTRMRLPNAEHDAPLTCLLHRVLRAVQRHARCTQGSEKARHSAVEAVRLAVREYFTSPSTSGNAGLCARMRGKQGTLRQNLMGWRVNSCARAVVAPDPCLAPWEVGVPGPIARELGLKDGDHVLMNRQPSLHRGAIMGHVVQVRPHDFCFSISPTVTPPYNADFDGDEMNLHITNVPSSADTRCLLGVENNLVSPSSGAVVVRPVQDACLARWLLTGVDAAGQRAELLRGCETRGSAAAARHLHHMQLDAHNAMQARGFSVGLDDFLCTIPVDGANQFTLGKAAAAALHHVPATNRIRQMVEAGSKGSCVNLAQLYGCVGFQTVRGKPATPAPGAPSSSAFVARSFTQGMRPHEFWMHACAAREGMIQTAVKTADAGYLMRRMVKTLENVSVAYDGTVRTAAGYVVQFMYGGDGMDPSTSRFETPCPVQAGEPVGVVCGQAIGAKLTQLTLDTFHSTGVAFKHGIARVKSLLDATSKDCGLLRGVPQPHRHVRYGVTDAVRRWTRATRSLPARVRFEMRLRNGSCAALVWRGELDMDWLAARGLKPWHVAARARMACPCACDGTYLYAASKEHGTGGEPWAGDTLAGGSVVLCTEPPLLHEGHLSEPPLVAARLGIEAACTVLRQELGEYMGGVDARHLHLLSDAMTQTGAVLGATRAGMRRADAVSVLGRACFETGPQILAAAASAGASDPLHAASSRLAMGLVPRVGSHTMSVVEKRAPAKPVRVRSFMDVQPAKRQRFDHFMTI